MEVHTTPRPTLSLPERRDPPDRLIGINVVLDRLGLSRTSLWRGVRLRRIPGPIHLGNRRLWSEREIQHFIDEQLQNRESRA